MHGSPEDWRPRAGRALLAQRAALLARARAFFAARNVLEVHTPVLVNVPVSDPQIQSLAVGADPRRYLHTSPEYAMKRLLAAGSGDIYQICPVFRGAERSRLHNPEFTLIEWYRLDFGLDALMQETAQLAQELLGSAPRIEYLSYAQAFTRELGLDPLRDDVAALRHAACAAGLATATATDCDRDALLDFLVATVVGPRLGQDALTCLHRYPATQASLARLDPADPRVALRFELYASGVELANGFVELGDAREQAARFASDRALRAQRGLPDTPPDERLLAALAAGLPDCAGVALGFDRLLMLAAGCSSIDEVLAFPVERA